MRALLLKRHCMAGGCCVAVADIGDVAIIYYSIKYEMCILPLLIDK
jgi:hypothetical protein